MVGVFLQLYFFYSQNGISLAVAIIFGAYGDNIDDVDVGNDYARSVTAILNFPIFMLIVEVQCSSVVHHLFLEMEHRDIVGGKLVDSLLVVVCLKGV